MEEPPMYGDFQVGREHLLTLRRADAADRAEVERAEADAEARQWRAAAAAPAYAEQLEIARAAADAEARRAEAVAEQDQADKAAAIEDWRTGLLMTGQGRWRTPAEVLGSAAGAMLMEPAGPPSGPGAQRSQYDADAALIARSHRMTAALTTDPVLRRARLAALEGEAIRQGSWIEPTAAYRGRPIPMQPGDDYPAAATGGWAEPPASAAGYPMMTRVTDTPVWMADF
jgi:hypothetical protein